jgi:hypothetical protein
VRDSQGEESATQSAFTTTIPKPIDSQAAWRESIKLRTSDTLATVTCYTYIKTRYKSDFPRINTINRPYTATARLLETTSEADSASGRLNPPGCSRPKGRFTSTELPCKEDRRRCQHWLVRCCRSFGRYSLDAPDLRQPAPLGAKIITAITSSG